MKVRCSLSQDAQLYTVQLEPGKKVEHKLDEGQICMGAGDSGRGEGWRQ